MKKHRKSTTGRRLKKHLYRWLATATICIVLGTSTYCWYLSCEIEKRFSGRRWNIPSRAYSDITLLYPGQQLNRELFRKKLIRMGYHQVPDNLKTEGSFIAKETSLNLFLRGFTTPSHTRESLQVSIYFTGDIIASITNLETADPVSILVIEPEEITQFYGPEHERRQLVSINEISEHLKHAVLAAEDRRFYQHYGLDPIGIIRALFVNIRTSSIRQGGSTITQQLSKNYFLTPERTMGRKAKESVMSLLIEALYSKDEILEIYLNEIYFGQKGAISINGIGEASWFYFDKPAKNLSLAEAATISGLIKAPNYYSPYINEQQALTRRNWVLTGMYENRWITDDDLLNAMSIPLTPSGRTVYRNKAPYFTDYLARQLQTFYPKDILSGYGLSIYTTLDMQVQTAAEQALEKGLSRMETANPELYYEQPDKKLQGAIIVMHPKTGSILAMVGGRKYSISQFNRITQAKRQPGSLFKPFVFLAGLDQFSPSSMLTNEPKKYTVDGTTWEPKNFSLISSKKISVREALARSINLAAVDLAMQIGIDTIISKVEAFEFSTSFKSYPSVALGAFEVIPIEIATAYCAFAGDGLLPYPPQSIKDVVSEHGKALQRRHMAIKNIFSPAKAYIINSLLHSVVTDGTARSLNKLGITFPVCGKTGTTNNYHDAWFVGYTPDILALVWVGFDNGKSIGTSSADSALPIWAELVKSIPQHISGNFFTMPDGVVKMNICSESRQKAVAGHCPETVEEVFLKELVPLTPCEIHYHENSIKKIFKKIKGLFKN